MKRLGTIFALFLLVTLGLVGCIGEEGYQNTPTGNFDALWQIIDEQYCFLDYKSDTYGLDWDEVYTTYKSRISDDMTEKGLFEVCADMLGELRDGHVNLYTAWDVARYWDWFEAYPANFSDSIQRNYLSTDYNIASSIYYKVLEDNIAYVYCGSFSSAFGNGNLTAMLQELAVCNGMILDVRNNSGGELTYAERLAERFTNEDTLVGYICHKTGTGHSDFSSPYPLYVESSSYIRWQKPVMLLTNRSSYSATNYFVNAMRQFPLVTTVGDTTGGGSGLPFSAELPNGWSIRFSASPMFDPDMNHIEFGIEPDIKVDITSEDYQNGIDTIIETARKLLE